MKKSEAYALLRKMARVNRAPKDDPAFSHPITPFSYANINGANAGADKPIVPQHVSTDVLPNRLYHHTFKNTDDTNMWRFSHIVSQSPDPADEGVSRVDLYGKPGNLQVGMSQVHNDHKGKNYGKLAYAVALNHHGAIQSGNQVSPQAQKTWESMKDWGVQTTIEPHGQSSTPNTGKVADKTKLHDTIRSLAPEKLASSERITNFDQYALAVLVKGQQGDWRNEGYTLHVTPLNGNRTSIKAKDKNNNYAGSIEVEKFPDGTHHSTWTTIEPEHRRKGLASAMYAHAEQHLGVKLEPSSFQSPAAEAMWAQPNRKFGKNEPLDKGQNGDWQKEGYTFKFDSGMRSMSPDGKTAFTGAAVSAHDPSGNFVGKVIFDTASESSEGKHTPRYGELVSGDTWVNEDHRRKGLASAMYAHAEQVTGGKFKPNLWRTDKGVALWSQPNRTFGKNEPLDNIESLKENDMNNIDDLIKRANDIHNLAKGDVVSLFNAKAKLKAAADEHAKTKAPATPPQKPTPSKEDVKGFMLGTTKTLGNQPAPKEQVPTADLIAQGKYGSVPIENALKLQRAKEAERMSTSAAKLKGTTTQEYKADGLAQAKAKLDSIKRSVTEPSKE